MEEMWDDEELPEPTSPSPRPSRRSSDTSSKGSSCTKTCMVGDCVEKKSGKARFCASHRRMVDNILEQAQKQNRKGEVERILDDPILLARACREFERDNPPGRFRKKLIDFSQFLKRYSHSVSYHDQQADEEWSFQEWSDEKTKAGWDAAKILKAWKGFSEDPNIVKGDGSNGETLWLPCRRKRIRDRASSIAAEFLEGSKPVKQMKAADAVALQDWGHDNLPSHSDTFFRKTGFAAEPDLQLPVGSLSRSRSNENNDAESTDIQQQRKKAKKVELAVALPTTQEAECKTIAKLKEQVVTSLDKAQKALDQAQAVGLEKLSVAGKAFCSTCSLRHCLGRLWLIQNEKDVKAFHSDFASRSGTAVVDFPSLASNDVASVTGVRGMTC